MRRLNFIVRVEMNESSRYGEWERMAERLAKTAKASSKWRVVTVSATGPFLTLTESGEYVWSKTEIRAK